MATRRARASLPSANAPGLSAAAELESEITPKQPVRRHTQAPVIGERQDRLTPTASPPPRPRQVISKDQQAPEGYRKKRVVRTETRTVPVPEADRIRYRVELCAWKLRRAHKSIKAAAPHARFQALCDTIVDSDAFRHAAEKPEQTLEAVREYTVTPYELPARLNPKNIQLQRKRDALKAAIRARDAELRGWDNAEKAADALSAARLPKGNAPPATVSVDAAAAKAALEHVAIHCQVADKRLRMVEAHAAKADATVKAAVKCFNEAVAGAGAARLAKTPRKPPVFPTDGEIPDKSPTITQNTLW